VTSATASRTKSSSRQASSGSTLGTHRPRTHIQNQLDKLMGLKFKRVIVGFDSIVPGLQAHRYDASFAGVLQQHQPEARGVAEAEEATQRGIELRRRRVAAPRFSDRR
jgi:ABC-type amino acid transport substrate-binding protein